MQAAQPRFSSALSLEFFPSSRSGSEGAFHFMLLIYTPWHLEYENRTEQLSVHVRSGKLPLATSRVGAVV